MTIPARLTVAELAVELESNVAAIQDILKARGEPDSPDDIVGPSVSVMVAESLGKDVSIEPRDLALETLYEADLYESDSQAAEERLTGRAARIVSGVLSGRDALDRTIEAASDHWSVARMPLVDRTILRIGLYELEEAPDVPTAVVVSEAVRLANTYSTERSGSFVNGVLATLAKETRG